MLLILRETYRSLTISRDVGNNDNIYRSNSIGSLSKRLIDPLDSLAAILFLFHSGIDYRYYGEYTIDYKITDTTGIIH